MVSEYKHLDELSGYEKLSDSVCRYEVLMKKYGIRPLMLVTVMIPSQSKPTLTE